MYPGRPVWLVADGRLARLDFRAYCRTSNIGNGRRRTDGSVTLSNGNIVKYLIKLPQADKLAAPAKEDAKIEKVSSLELERLRTGLSTGDNPLPMSSALKISQVAVEAR
jgi:hypothetical protein